MADYVDILTTAVLTNGFRLTTARQAIIGALVACGGHITADNLASMVQRTTPQIGRMTVYRTLDLLTQLGVIRPAYQGSGAAHYVLMDDGGHHHLICTRCHEVIDFDDCTAGELAQRLSERFDFQVSSHLLELHGLCADCQK